MYQSIIILNNLNVVFLFLKGLMLCLKLSGHIQKLTVENATASFQYSTHSFSLSSGFMSNIKIIVVFKNSA